MGCKADETLRHMDKRIGNRITEIGDHNTTRVSNHLIKKLNVLEILSRGVDSPLHPVRPTNVAL